MRKPGPCETQSSHDDHYNSFRHVPNLQSFTLLTEWKPQRWFLHSNRGQKPRKPLSNRFSLKKKSFFAAKRHKRRKKRLERSRLIYESASSLKDPFAPFAPFCDKNLLSIFLERDARGPRVNSFRGSRRRACSP